MHVLEYKCPCCASALVFDDQSQKLKCNACENSFEVDAIEQLAEEHNRATFQWDERTESQWTADEEAEIHSFSCPSCGGEILTDATTAATFCPYCESPAIIGARLGQALRPDGVLPFQTSKEDAKAAFLKFCKKKPLLPKFFMERHRVERITGIYVPFWLYDCNCIADNSYKATRIHRWSDSRYHYTRTDHFLLRRKGSMAFDGIPMDAASKMNNVIMESIEPFDYSQIVDFNTAYLSGFFADKYDVSADAGHARVQERIETTVDGAMRSTCIGYASVIPVARNLQVSHGKCRYVLLPVWMLHTKYKDKTYVFAMNGQTGKLTGTLPVCAKRSWAWFGIIAGAVTAASFLVQLLAAL